MYSGATLKIRGLFGVLIVKWGKIIPWGAKTAYSGYIPKVGKSDSGKAKG